VGRRRPKKTWTEKTSISDKKRGTNKKKKKGGGRQSSGCKKWTMLHGTSLAASRKKNAGSWRGGHCFLGVMTWGSNRGYRVRTIGGKNMCFVVWEEQGKRAKKKKGLPATGKKIKTGERGHKKKKKRVRKKLQGGKLVDDANQKE